MANTALNLFYATNRRHIGTDRWRPRGYGTAFSADGLENLRFGRVRVNADAARITQFLDASHEKMGRGQGTELAQYLSGCAKKADIHAYPERLDATVSDSAQPEARLGSRALFAEVQDLMLKGSDVLVYVHGFNVSWPEAVGSALALQLALNRNDGADPGQTVSVVLFTWPSDGMALPFASYKSDRSEAKASGYAIGRGFLKLRDFLINLRGRARAEGTPLCDQSLHLLCHSMGNYVLQNALGRMDRYTPGNALPRLFENIFLCAPDVDENALEPEGALGRVHELAREVTLYYNRGDLAMYVSDYTKGNPERLGTHGAARPALMHNKIQQVDCSEIVSGTVEHSYYLDGWINLDIRHSLEALAANDTRRQRVLKGELSNVWTLLRPA
ncbi:MAG: alpha/beta hydrolase [Nevskiales bacterium]|nr:alpha/beta hydrolase [Nevskiales bacterium]